MDTGGIRNVLQVIKEKNIIILNSKQMKRKKTILSCQDREQDETRKKKKGGLGRFTPSNENTNSTATKSPNVTQIQFQLPTLCSSHPSGGSAVVVDEERPTVGGDAHLPAWRQEALLRLVLRLGRAVR